MMVHGVKRSIDCGPYFFYKKHYCQTCQTLLERRKREKIVNSASPEAKNYNFSLADISLAGNIKFITYFFACPKCQVTYEILQLKKIEKMDKRRKKQLSRNRHKML